MRVIAQNAAYLSERILLHPFHGLFAFIVVFHWKLTPGVTIGGALSESLELQSSVHIKKLVPDGQVLQEQVRQMQSQRVVSSSWYLHSYLRHLWSIILDSRNIGRLFFDQIATL